MGKGDTYRPYSTTQEERDLRDKAMRTNMTEKEFDKEYEKLKKQGLIKRDGRVIK